MTTIRIRKKLDSETLHLPELRPLIGRTVEIVVAEQPEPSIRDEFYATVARIPETESEWNTRCKTYQTWRDDSRFESFLPLIELLLSKDFASTRPWAAAAAAAQHLDGYDFDAWREQREFDRQQTGDCQP